MKRLCCILICAALVLSFSACGLKKLKNVELPPLPQVTETVVTPKPSYAPASTPEPEPTPPPHPGTTPKTGTRDRTSLSRHAPQKTGQGFRAARRGNTTIARGEAEAITAARRRSGRGRSNGATKRRTDKQGPGHAGATKDATEQRHPKSHSLPSLRPVTS